MQNNTSNIGGLCEMKVPFLDLKKQWQALKQEIEPAVLKLIESGSFIGGGFCADFEKQMQEYLGVRHAIGCNSGTDALTLALRACNVKSGDEVITTPFTFFATAEAIASIGAIPVFVDIKENDYTIDPTKIEDAICDKTKAIIPVHIFGAPCDMDRILEISHKYGLKVIEDDAQAIGSSYKGKKAGTIGDVGCFSFYPTKNLGGCGDGGMCTTNDEQLDAILRGLCEHGAGENGARAAEYLGGVKTQAVTNEPITELYNPYKYFNYLIGYNSRLDAIQACVLSIKLKHLEEYNTRRRSIARRYFEGLTDKVICPAYSIDDVNCWHQFVVRSEHKQELCNYLSKHGIGNGTFYPVPLHKQNAFNKANCKNPDASLPIAEKIASQSVCLPIYPELTDEQVQYVIDAVNGFYN